MSHFIYSQNRLTISKFPSTSFSKWVLMPILSCENEILFTGKLIVWMDVHQTLLWCRGLEQLWKWAIFLFKSQLAFFLTVKRFPVEDYKPLQDPPFSDVAKAMELISCLERLLPAVSLTVELPWIENFGELSK